MSLIKLSFKMNKQFYYCLVSIILAITVVGCSSNQVVSFKNEGNPLVSHIYTADPSARVFDGKLYLYTSHDKDDTDHDAHFDMTDWHVFSTDNLTDWLDHGAFFGLDNIQWASKQAWAPDAVKRNGKYYFYYPVEQAKIGVAVSDSPTSGFKDPIGKPLIDKTGQEELIGREPIDPGILIDDDGQAYMYFGCRDARVVKLKENMIELDGEVRKIQINGIQHFNEETNGWYGEGPWMFKRDNYYYYIYSNGWKKDSTLVYAMATNPMGPFDYVGEVMTPVGAGTSHGSITKFKDKWYLFYHSRLLSGKGKQRSVHFDEISFDKTGKIIPFQYIKRNQL